MIERISVDGYSFSVDYGEPDGDDVFPAHEDLENWIFPDSIDPDALYAGEYDQTVNKAMAEFRRRWPDVKLELEEPCIKYDVFLDGDIHRAVEYGERSWA